MSGTPPMVCLRCLIRSRILPIQTLLINECVLSGLALNAVLEPAGQAMKAGSLTDKKYVGRGCDPRRWSV
jgi:hypothetical protein